MFRSARRRLTWMYAVTGVVLFALLAAGIYGVLIGFLDREIDSDIEDVLEQGLDLVRLDPEGQDLTVPVAFGPAFLFVFGADGQVIRNPRDLPASEVIPVALVRSVVAGGEPSRVTRSAGGDRFRLHLLPLVQDGDTTVVIAAGRSLARRDAEVRLVTITLAASAVIWVVLASGAAYVLAGRALEPVRRAYTRQEAFVAGAAHELRSPIGVIRAASDVGLRGDASAEVRSLLGEINAVATEATGLVDTLLDLARMREQSASDGATSDLAEVVGRELSRMDLLLREHDVRVVDDLSRALVAVPSAEIGRITRALLENVIAHTPRGTTLVVRTRRLSTMGELSVEDDGPGLPSDEIESAFEPFARGDEARRRGRRVGMGLTIVQSVAAYYGGRARARTPDRGTGLVVEVHLPAV